MAVTSLAMRGAATGRVAVGFPWEVRQDALASTDGPMSIWGFLRDEVGGLYWTKVKTPPFLADVARLM